MNASLFRWIRLRARGVSVALVLAFVLPILLAVLPQPALSADAQLARDIASNVCVPGDEQAPAVQHGHEECCILCATGLPPVGEGKLLGGIALPEPQLVQSVAVAEVQQAPPREPPFVSSISLRGPPAL